MFFTPASLGDAAVYNLSHQQAKKKEKVIPQINKVKLRHVLQLSSPVEMRIESSTQDVM